MTELLLKLFVKNYKDIDKPSVRKKYGFLGSFYGLVTNFLLFVAKIVIGVLLGLFSIVTDSMNNLSDFGNNFISIVGVKASSKKADKEHPYGHQRVEYILSLIISCIIIGLSMVMMYQGVLDCVSFFKAVLETGKPPIGDLSYPMYVVSLCVLSFAILVKFSQALVYFSLGKRIDSMPLKALGKDARNDVITTIFVIIGIIITWFSSFSVDCFFTIVVSIFVALSGISIMKEAISALIGEEPDKTLVQNLISLIKSHSGVLGIHDLSLHYYGKVIYGVIHVEVDDRVDINISHQLVDHIERECLKKLGVHLTIHMDPITLDDAETNEIRECLLSSLGKYSTKKILMHDLHLYRNEKKEILEFELVVPDDFDEKEQDKIRLFLFDQLEEQFNKDYVLNIGFDSEVQDFLYDTDAQER